MVQNELNARYASCPDESVDMVFSTAETGIPTAVSCIQSLSRTASGKGYNVKTLTGSAENRAAVLNW